MITERLMAVGEWSLELDDAAPTSIRRTVAKYGSNIFVLPTHMIDTSISLANLTTLAVYGGLVFRKGNQLRRFGGPGMLGYLQTGQGESGFTGTGIAGPFPATYSAILSRLLPGDSRSNGINDGTSFSAFAVPTVTLVTGTNWPPTKSVIDTISAQTGNEYRIRPTGNVDYGDPTVLFRNTPTVCVAPGMSGRDGSLIVLDTTQWDYNEDIDNYRNYGNVLSQDLTYGAGFGATAAGAISFNIYNDTTGLFVQFGNPRTVSDTNVSAQVDAIATATANSYCAPNLTIRCSVKEFCIPRLLIPGDWIHVYSRDDDVVDVANQITFNGQNLAPKKLRCTGYSYPIEQGMGVYHYYPFSGSGVITDITDFVKWETGDTSLEIESKPVSINDVPGRSIAL